LRARALTHAGRKVAHCRAAPTCAPLAVRPATALLLLTLAGTAATACGASLNAVYEGDVRFERCMALDSRPDVKPTIRRACWEEWVRFYTFGQTRDRVEYATLRQKQLRRASDFDEGEWVPPSSRNASAVPEPTSALAPPPMMLVADAGAPTQPPPNAADAAPPPSDAEPLPASDCTEECKATRDFCLQECKSPACEKSCDGKYKRCMKRCF